MSIQNPETETFEAIIRRNRMTPEQVAELVKDVPPFSFEEWERIAPPATPDELAEMEEFLRLREEERQESLAREAGIAVSE